MEDIVYNLADSSIEYIKYQSYSEDLPSPEKEYEFLSKVAGMIGETGFQARCFYDPKFFEKYFERETKIKRKGRGASKKQAKAERAATIGVSSSKRPASDIGGSVKTGIAGPQYDYNWYDVEEAEEEAGEEEAEGEEEVEIIERPVPAPGAPPPPPPAATGPDLPVSPAPVVKPSPTTAELQPAIKPEVAPIVRTGTEQVLTSPPPAGGEGGGETSRQSIAVPSEYPLFAAQPEKYYFGARPISRGGRLPIYAGHLAQEIDIEGLLKSLRVKGSYYRYLLLSDVDKLSGEEREKRQTLIDSYTKDEEELAKRVPAYKIAKKGEEGDKFDLRGKTIPQKIPMITNLAKGNIELAIAQLTERVLDTTVIPKISYRRMIMNSSRIVQTWFAKLVAANIERALTVSGSKRFHSAFKPNRANSDIAGVAPRFANLIYDTKTGMLDLKQISYYPDKNIDFIARGASLAGVAYY